MNQINIVLVYSILIQSACNLNFIYCSSDTKIAQPLQQVARNVGFRGRLERIEQWIPKLIWPLIESIKQYKLINVNVSLQCKVSLDRYINDLDSRHRLALQVHDSGGKFRPGFIGKGLQSDLGYFEQCPKATHRHYFVEFDWPLADYNERVDRIELNSSGHWLDKVNRIHHIYYSENQVQMICLPLNCSTSEYVLMADEFTFASKLPLRLKFSYDADDDKINQFIHIKTVSLLILVTLAITITFATVAKCFHLDLSAHPIINCLNMVENTSKLFQQSKTTETDRSLLFLHGYRFFYCFTGLFVHLLATAPIQSKFINGTIIRFRKLANNFYSLKAISIAAYLQNGPFGPDSPVYKAAFLNIGTNFALSGLLAYQSWAPILKATNGQLMFLTFACVRYLRTLPVIIAGLLMALAFPVSLGSGPVFRTTVNTITSNTVERGWAELAAISNIFNVDSIVSNMNSRIVF